MAELIVHEIPPAWGLSSIGPFCLKLEAWLKLADIPYRGVVDATPFRGPKRKLPWIEHDGAQLGDSGFIIDYLKERFGRDPDASLGAEARAIGHAMRRLLEENLYWVMVYDRWLVEANWPLTRSVVLGRIPPAARALIAPLARSGVRRQLAGHGIGRHTRQEIHAIGCRDIDAIVGVLGDKPYLLGDVPAEVDTVAYGLLANIMHVPVVSPVKDYALAIPALRTYVERLRQRWFAGPG